MKKKSFWQKVIGTVPEDETDSYGMFEMEEYEEDEAVDMGDDMSEESEGGILELSVDLYDNGDDIILEAFIPGVSLEDLNIELAREQIHISGAIPDTVQTDKYYVRELRKGDFERTISLPEEIDIDASTAVEYAGVLKITLPKFNKSRKAKLQVKSIRT